MSLYERLQIYKEHDVLVLPEDICVHYKPEPNCVLIRIKADASGNWKHLPEWTTFKPLQHPEMYVEVLEIVFDDVDRPQDGKVIQPEQARSIVKFFDKHRDKKLVVHCAAGISRSSATACAWGVFHQKPEIEAAIRSRHCFIPNAVVYRTLVNEIESLDWFLESAI